MPLVKKIKAEAGILEIWELIETIYELERIFNFSEKEREEYQQIKNERRKAEYLSIRIMTQQILGKKVEIAYLPSRKPVLKNDTSFISVSHSKNLVAVLITKKHHVGIDTELIDRNIDRVAKRFLSAEEVNHIRQFKNQQIGKILYWCAKESIFKCTPHDGIQFNSQILIIPFRHENKGSFFGMLKTDSGHENFKLWYFPFKNNMVVYCVPLNVD